MNPENGGFGSAKLIWETDKVNRRLEGVVGALEDKPEQADWKNYDFGSGNSENGGFDSEKLIWKTDIVNRRMVGAVGALQARTSHGFVNVTALDFTK